MNASARRPVAAMCAATAAPAARLSNPAAASIGRSGSSHVSTTGIPARCSSRAPSAVAGEPTMISASGRRDSNADRMRSSRASS